MDVLTLKSADRAAYLRAQQFLDPLGVPIETAAAQFAEAKRALGDVPLSQAVEFYLLRHPQMIFRHYRELVRPTDAKRWFAIEPKVEGKATVIPKVEESVAVTA